MGDLILLVFSSRVYGSSVVQALRPTTLATVITNNGLMKFILESLFEGWYGQLVHDQTRNHADSLVKPGICNMNGD